MKRILKVQHTMADKLARGGMSSPSAMLYDNSIPPFWLVVRIDGRYVLLSCSHCCQKNNFNVGHQTM